MPIVDPDALSRRLLALNEALNDLSRPEAGSAERLIADRVLRAAVERWLQIAIEACIDVAFSVVAAHEWTPPDTARAAFVTLGAHGMISADLALRLSSAAGLRNILVHEYVAVDLERIARIVREDLGDLRAFGTAAASWKQVD